MPLNVPAPLSSAVQPRGAVLVNGTALEAGRVLAEFFVEQNAYYTPDRFTAKLVLSRLPPGFDATFWGSATDATFELRIGFANLGDGSLTDVTSLIIGRVDTVDIDWVRGLVSIEGRDRTADLIETKITEKFPNKTASQIAQQFAAEHGLTADVTATTTPVGQYYKDEHAQLESETTEWDLLTFLAQCEPDFIVYVSGTTLYFGPKPSETDTPYELRYVPPGPGAKRGNFEHLQTSRTLTLARDITVYVRSWNQKQSAGFTVKATATNAHKINSGTSKVKGQEFFFQLANSTRDQALRYARAKLAELTQHERVITGELPGDPALTMRVPVTLVGTNTEWDQVYFPDTIGHTFGPSEGYRMALRAKNHSPQSVVLV